MRVDNGFPFGDPTLMTTPALSLWLIAVDIDMIWNAPRRPQQNGQVEKLQDTTARWAEISTAVCQCDLQQRLNSALSLQREHYPVRRLAAKTRLEVFPLLTSSRRLYSASDFQAERVYAFLCQKLYTRKVAANGQIGHYGQVFYVGWALRHQWVQLQLKSDGSCWQVFANYQLIKKLPAHHLSEQHIQNLTIGQKLKCPT